MTRKPETDLPKTEDATGVLPPLPGSGFSVVAEDSLITWKKPRCPYCGEKLTASANCWEQEPDGSWIATELDVNCVSEPDIDSPEWDDWWDSHSYDFCHGWQDAAESMLRWLRKHVRFDLQNKD